jgi:amino acid permease
MKTKMIISYFWKSFSSFFFPFLGLNENGSDNRKNENENNKINWKRKRKRFCPLLTVFEDYRI